MCANPTADDSKTALDLCISGRPIDTLFVSQ